MGCSKRELLNNADYAIENLREQENDVTNELLSTSVKISNIKKEIDSLFIKISTALVSSLDELTIEIISREIGFLKAALFLENYNNTKKKLAFEISSIYSNPKYINRDQLLGDDKDSLTSNKNNYEKIIFELEEKFNVFRQEPYRWLVRDLRSNNKGFFDMVIGFFNGKNKTRKQYLQAIMNRLKVASLEEAVQLEIDMGLFFADVKEKLNMVNADIDYIYSLVERLGEMENKLENIDCDHVSLLRKGLVKFLYETNLLEVYATIREEFKQDILTAFQLIEKTKYLEQISMSLLKLKTELKEKSDSIYNVRKKWSRSSKSYFNDNKEEWLINSVNARKAKTSKFISSCDRVSSSIYDYDDYSYYGHLLCNGITTGVLALCVANAAEAMPSHAVIENMFPDMDLGLGVELPDFTENNFEQDAILSTIPDELPGGLNNDADSSFTQEAEFNSDLS